MDLLRKILLIKECLNQQFLGTMHCSIGAASDSIKNKSVKLFQKHSMYAFKHGELLHHVIIVITCTSYLPSHLIWSGDNLQSINQAARLYTIRFFAKHQTGGCHYYCL